MFMVMTKLKKPGSLSVHEISQLKHTRVAYKEI
jgi:hypothetical protein